MSLLKLHHLWVNSVSRKSWRDQGYQLWYMDTRVRPIFSKKVTPSERACVRLFRWHLIERPFFTRAWSVWNRILVRSPMRPIFFKKWRIGLSVILIHICSDNRHFASIIVICLILSILGSVHHYYALFSVAVNKNVYAIGMFVKILKTRWYIIYCQKQELINYVCVFSSEHLQYFQTRVFAIGWYFEVKKNVSCFFTFYFVYFVYFSSFFWRDVPWVSNIFTNGFDALK